MLDRFFLTVVTVVTDVFLHENNLNQQKSSNFYWLISSSLKFLLAFSQSECLPSPVCSVTSVTSAPQHFQGISISDSPDDSPHQYLGQRGVDSGRSHCSSSPNANCWWLPMILLVKSCQILVGESPSLAKSYPASPSPEPLYPGRAKNRDGQDGPPIVVRRKNHVIHMVYNDICIYFFPSCTQLGR